MTKNEQPLTTVDERPSVWDKRRRPGRRQPTRAERISPDVDTTSARPAQGSDRTAHPEHPSRIASHVVRNVRTVAIGFSEKAVLYSIADRLNRDGLTWASAKCLAEDAGGARTTVTEIVAWLRAERIIVSVDGEDENTYTLDLERLRTLPHDLPPRKIRGGRRRPVILTGSTHETSGSTDSKDDAPPDNLSGSTVEMSGSRRLPSDDKDRGSGQGRPDPHDPCPDPQADLSGFRAQRIQEGSSEGSKKDPFPRTREVGSSDGPEVNQSQPPPMLPPSQALPQGSLFGITPPPQTDPPRKSQPGGKVAKDPTPAKPKPEPKKREKKPAEEQGSGKQAHTLYLEAYCRGMAKGAGTVGHGEVMTSLKKMELVEIAKQHAKREGRLLVGDELLAWFETRAEAFRRHAPEEIKYPSAGGWTVKGFLWWLNQGCPGEPVPVPYREPKPLPPSGLELWKARYGPIDLKPEETLEKLLEEVDRPSYALSRPLTPEEEIDDAYLREMHDRKVRQLAEDKKRWAEEDAAAERTTARATA